MRRLPDFQRRVKAMVLGLLAGCSVLMGTAAQAQVSINPFKLRLVVEPGARETVQVLLSNPSEKAVTVRISAEDFVQGPAGEILYVPAGSAPHGLADLISVAPALVTIPPKSQAKARLTVRLPAQASGDYYCVLAAVDESVPAGRHAFVTEVASVAIVTAAGSPPKKASLVGFTSIHDPKQGPMVLATLQNDCPLRLFADVSVDILDADGVLTAKARGRGYLYPDSTRTVRVQLPELPGGDYVLVARANYGGDETPVAHLVYSNR